jgi:hypothetical protein
MDAVDEILENTEWHPTDNPNQIVVQLEALLKNRLLPPED